MFRDRDVGTLRWDIDIAFVRIAVTMRLGKVGAIDVTVTVDVVGMSLVAVTFLFLGRGSGIIRLAFSFFTFSFLFLVTSSLVGWEAAEGIMSVVVGSGSHDEMRFFFFFFCFGSVVFVSSSLFSLSTIAAL
jgi:hypothetical protein